MYYNCIHLYFYIEYIVKQKSCDSKPSRVRWLHREGCLFCDTLEHGRRTTSRYVHGLRVQRVRWENILCKQGVRKNGKSMKVNTHTSSHRSWMCCCVSIHDQDQRKLLRVFHSVVNENWNEHGKVFGSWANRRRLREGTSLCYEPQGLSWLVHQSTGLLLRRRENNSIASLTLSFRRLLSAILHPPGARAQICQLQRSRRITAQKESLTAHFCFFIGLSLKTVKNKKLRSDSNNHLHNSLIDIYIYVHIYT